MTEQPVTTAEQAIAAILAALAAGRTGRGKRR